MNNIGRYNKQHNFFKSFKNKKSALLIPFAILTLVLFIVPVLLIFIKPFIPVEGATIEDN
jgi:uncharacterized membrane protein (DUF485 family)